MGQLNYVPLLLPRYVYSLTILLGIIPDDMAVEGIVKFPAFVVDSAKMAQVNIILKGILQEIGNKNFKDIKKGEYN